MSLKLHNMALALKLFLYFILGLIAASAIVLWLIKKPISISESSPPGRSLPAHLPAAPEYIWSPDFTKVAFQVLKPDSEQSQIIIFDLAKKSSTTLTTLNNADFWVSSGQVNLAWLGLETLAYSPIITDDSLPNWEIIGRASTTNTIWNDRDLISFSPDSQNALTVVSPPGFTPSQSLTYEIVILQTNRILKTSLDALKTNCTWFENNSLKCYYTSDPNKKIPFIIKFSPT